MKYIFENRVLKEFIYKYPESYFDDFDYYEIAQIYDTF